MADKELTPEFVRKSMAFRGHNLHLSEAVKRDIMQTVIEEYLRLQSLSEGELREQVDNLITMFEVQVQENNESPVLFPQNNLRDQLSALFTASNQAAELRGIDTATKAYESTCECLIQAAVKKEQERIVKLAIDNGVLCSKRNAGIVNCVACKSFWQALQQPQEKEGK